VEFRRRPSESVGDFLDSLKPDTKRKGKLEDGVEIDEMKSQVLSAALDVSDNSFRRLLEAKTSGADDRSDRVHNHSSHFGLGPLRHVVSAG
jgi:hypothetical protein